MRPARTPKGTEVRTVIKRVTKRLRTHWPNTRIVWRGDSARATRGNAATLPRSAMKFSFIRPCVTDPGVASSSST
jgi:hypothetical protein